MSALTTTQCFALRDFYLNEDLVQSVEMNGSKNGREDLFYYLSFSIHLNNLMTNPIDITKNIRGKTNKRSKSILLSTNPKSFKQRTKPFERKKLINIK